MPLSDILFTVLNVGGRKGIELLYKPFKNLSSLLHNIFSTELMFTQKINKLTFNKKKLSFHDMKIFRLIRL